MGKVTRSVFGTTKGGEEVLLFRLEGGGGAYTEVISYGAGWKNSCVPNKQGGLTAVCLGYDDLAGYEADTSSIGIVVGRYANRIGGAEFTLNGETYRLPVNNLGKHCLHGGLDRFGNRVWASEVLEDGVRFTLRSADGDQGFPGNMTATATYRFSEGNALSIDYTATTDKDTVVNLTNHAYFNLSGAESGAAGAMAHTLKLNAGRVTDVDDECITNGEFVSVDGTPFDFRTERVIGERVDTDCRLINVAGGYDINYAVDGAGLREAAALASPKTGVSMDVYFTNPGVQFYSGNNLKPPFERRGAVCLEPQFYPNSVNRPGFPTSVLKAGETYTERTEYRFGVR